MEESEVQEIKINKFRSIKRKVVDASHLGLIKTDFLSSGKTLPLLIRPENPDVDLEDWARNNGEFIEAQLSKYGGLLFRGFGLESARDFERSAAALSPNLFGDYGDLPKEKSGEAIYQSTPYPPEQTILFHNEAAHTHRWPMKQFFFCVKAAREGGETPVADCREVYRLLDPKLTERLGTKQVMYVRNFNAGLDVSWQDFFKSTDRSAVEARCRQSSIDFEWKPNDGLRIRQLCPAVLQHPKTRETVFFNQVQLHHLSSLAPSVRESLLSVFSEEDLPRNVYYGDGSPIEDSVMEEIGDAYWKAAASFAWQRGDLLMLDNMLVAHARKPYVGERKIVVAMAEMFDHRQGRDDSGAV